MNGARVACGSIGERSPGVRGTLALATAVLAIAALAGCAPEEPVQDVSPTESAAPSNSLPEAPIGPEGTVLFVDDLPITAAEIDRLAASVELLYPSYTANHARRIVLAEFVLPRLAVASLFPEERERARKAAEQARAEISDAPEEAWLAKRGGVRFDVQGQWKKIGGVDMWTLARNLDEGVWSQPFERTGTFNIVRRGPIKTGETPHHELLELTILTFPYLPGDDALLQAEEALDQARLRIVDPAWEEIVPEEFKYRMDGR